MGSEVTPIILPPGLAGTLEPSLGKEGGTEGRVIGVQPFNPQLRAVSALNSASKHTM